MPFSKPSGTFVTRIHKPIRPLSPTGLNGGRAGQAKEPVNPYTPGNAWVRSQHCGY